MAFKKFMSFFITTIFLALPACAQKEKKGLDLRLHQAAAEGDLAKVQSYLQQKLDVNSLDQDGYPAFYYALDQENEELALTLLRAPMNLDLKIGPGKDSLLVAAIRKNSAGSVAFLLKERPQSLQTPDENGFTPLMIAARYSKTEILKHLLNAGADASAKNKFGSTALDIAQKAQNKSNIEALQSALRARPKK